MSRSYTPTKKAIKTQLDNLLDCGDISMGEYEFGMVGLNFIHGMLLDAGVLCKPESDNLKGIK